jgi:hypothetical protein
MWCCILPTHTCKPRRLGVKNTIRCVSHQNRNHLPSLCLLHHTLYTSLFMFYTIPWNMIATVTSMTACVSLYTPPYLVISTYFWSKKDIFIRLETVDSIEGEWKSCNTYILENSTTHTEHITVYITHFTSQSIFVLKVLLLMQSEQLCDGIHYLTEDIILNVWVKMVHCLQYHTINEISESRFTCLWYTPRYIYHTPLCTLSENYDT